MSKKDVKIGGENDETFSHRRTSGWKNRRRTAAMLISLLSYISAIGGPLSKGPLFIYVFLYMCCSANYSLSEITAEPSVSAQPNPLWA